jgi:hypothetical protein
MKRSTLSVLFAAIVCAAAFAGGSKETASDQSLKKIMDKGVFVLGLDDSFPPMGFRDANNEIVGYDIDLAKEATKRMGVKLQLQPIDWNAKEQKEHRQDRLHLERLHLSHRTGQGIASTNPNQERQAWWSQGSATSLATSRARASACSGSSAADAVRRPPTAWPHQGHRRVKDT